MAGGAVIAQLAAKGNEDMFLTEKPQITFFKSVYKKHTNFSIEGIRQNFDNVPNWGKTVTCNISKSGDLISNITLVIKLPKIEVNSFDEFTKFAYVYKLGYAMINTIEVEINGRTIDRHYGEWLNILGELFEEKNNGYHKRIGNIQELYTFTTSKNEYTLYIPLKFWFCGNSINALPLIAMNYSEIKIRLELNDFNNCHIISPTHYIKCEADIVNFKQYEYIEQNIDGKINAGIFSHFDSITQRLYYTKITDDKLVGIKSNLTTQQIGYLEKEQILNDIENQKYRIHGKTTEFYIMPGINENSMAHSYNRIINYDLLSEGNKQSHLIVDYIYLDNDERMKIARTEHEYLINTLYFTPPIKINTMNRSFKLNIENPCKSIFWITQLDYIYRANDIFNYTNNYIHKLFNEDDKLYPDKYINESVGSNLILNEGLLFNGNYRIQMRDEKYFTNIQPYQNTQYSPDTGINMYYFELYPTQSQPSGSCNMTKINTIEIQTTLQSIINTNITASFRAYALCHNIFVVKSGIAGIKFDK